jgi:hypothetical protein
MKWNFKVNITTILVLVLGVVVFFWWNGQKNSEINRWIGNYDANVGKYELYKSIVDDRMIVKDKAIELLSEELKAVAQSDSIQRELVKKYKRLAAVIKIETEFIHDTVKVNVPIHIENDTIVEIWSDCLELDVRLSTGFFALENIFIENRQDIVLGARKTGLFKTSQYVEVRNQNPCIQIQGMTSYVVVHEKKWWENPIITTLGGFTAGWAVGKLSK